MDYDSCYNYNCDDHKKRKSGTISYADIQSMMVDQSNEEPVSFSINKSIKKLDSEIEESPIMMTEKSDVSNSPPKKHCQVDWVHPASIFILIAILVCYT